MRPSPLRVLPSIAFGLMGFVAAAAPLFAQAGMLVTTGNQSEVRVPDSPSLVPSTGYTIEAWFFFNPAAPGGNSSPTIVRKNTMTPSYILRTTSTVNGTLEYYANTGGTYYTLNSGVPTPINSWHHLAGTHDGAIARLYLDGVQIGSLPVPGPPGFVPGDLLISKGDPASESWHGAIDEVRLWSFAKTAAQIQQTMFHEQDNVPGLVASWHFNFNYLDTTGGHHGITNGQNVLVPSTSPVSAELLTAPATSPIGAPITFAIASIYAFNPYLFDVSVTGNSPGVLVPPPINKIFPLNPPFLNAELGSYVPGVFDDFLGFTDAGGNAAPALNVPPFPSLTGMPISASYVLLDAASPYGIRHVGNGTLTTIGGFAPTVASVVPATVPVAGGFLLTISGTHFQPGATVKIDGVNVAPVSFVNAQTLTVTSPPSTLGQKAVLVTNPDGFASSGVVTYVPNLAMTSIGPLVAAPGATVTIAGAGFQPGLTITLGGASIPASSVSASAVTFVVPPSPPCSTTVAVTNPSGQAQALFWNPAPSIQSVVGGTGPAAGGGTFFVLGTGFVAGTTITIGGAAAAISSVNATTIFATAPPGSVGPASLVVTTPGGCAATSTYTYQ